MKKIDADQSQGLTYQVMYGEIKCWSLLGFKGLVIMLFFSDISTGSSIVHCFCGNDYFQ